MRRIFLIIIGLFSLIPLTQAGDFPFTDVKQSDPYYSAVKELYDGGVITNDGDNLFKPQDLMNRDFYISLVVGVGCKKCTTPSQEDIFKYQFSPFVDLPKINPYYYCVAYAADVGITQGYTLNTSGKSTCEDGQTYSSVPFCALNTITRIEATAVLLRRAGLWNETLNKGNFDRGTIISDASSYWYGYAKKGLEVGLISKKSNGTIGQDEKITRGEFAIMAAKILKYTQCQTKNYENSMEGEIGIIDENHILTKKSSFELGEKFDLIPVTSTGQWLYSWDAKNPLSKKVLSGNGDVFTGSLFSTGTWIVTLDIIDPSTKKTVSRPNLTLVIYDNTVSVIKPCLSVALRANPLVTYIDNIIDFSAFIKTCNDSDIIYHWDYGDNNTSSTKGDTHHGYREPGIYTVTLTVTDPKTGDTSQSTLIVKITGDKDIDHDGTFDQDDACVSVYGPKNNQGCPIIKTIDTREIVKTLLEGENLEGEPCYQIGYTGSLQKGCPQIPSVDGIEENACIRKKLLEGGILFGSPVCDICPCPRSIKILSAIRSCDILFPSILSPDEKLIYSRGGFYTVP